MQCNCPIDARIIKSEVAEQLGRKMDILTFQCPKCKREWIRVIVRPSENETENRTI